MNLDDAIEAGLKNAEANRSNEQAIMKAVLGALAQGGATGILALILECRDFKLEPADIAESWSNPLAYKWLAWKYESKFGSFWIVVYSGHAYVAKAEARKTLEPGAHSAPLDGSDADVGRIASLLGVFGEERPATQEVRVALGTTVLYSPRKDSDNWGNGTTRLATIVNSNGDGSGLVELHVLTLISDDTPSICHESDVAHDPSGAPGTWRFMPPGFEADLTKPLEK